ncbi:MAG: imelysin family protein [Cytophagales bacterium]|nr:imelysin family protein [Cytophagales bacterium]
MISHQKLSLLSSVLFLLSACDPKSGENTQVEFDRVAMYTHLADELIMPALRRFQSELDILQATLDSLAAQPQTAQLAAAQAQWKKTALAWQKAELYCRFGPGSFHLAVFQINNFPAKASEVEAFASQTNPDLNTADARSARGLPALDYLLFGGGTSPAEIATLYANSSTRRAYLQALAQHLQASFEPVLQEWEQSYLAKFKTNDGTGSTQSLALLTNAFTSHNDDLEKLKVRFALNLTFEGESLGAVRPDLLEAPYSRYSKELALAASQSALDFFMGNDLSGQVPSFYTYLIALDRKTASGQVFANEARSRLQAVADAFEPVQGDFYTALSEEATDMRAIFDRMREAIVSIKSDLFVAFGVNRSGTDTDGD